MTPDGYLEGWYSLLDPPGRLALTEHPSRPDLLDPIRDATDVRRLEYFTKGFYRVRDVDGEVVITDLRMGAETYYVFSFAVGSRDGRDVRAIRPRQLAPGPIDARRLRGLMRRIGGPAPIPD